MQLESGTRVNLNALFAPKDLHDEGLDFHILLKNFPGYCKGISE